MLDQLFIGEIWSGNYFGNALKDYVIALGTFVLLLIVFKIFQAIILHRAKKVAERTKTDIDDALIGIVKSIKPPFYSFIAFYLALRYLSLNNIAQKVVDVILIVWVVYQVIAVVQILVSYIIRKSLGKEKKKDAKAAISAINIVLKLVLWSLGLLFILSNLGINVTSLVAGLGIGGIAVALAAQNILGDLFSSFAIFFDKPFTIGDVITVGQDTGTVEKIGMKTSRLRSFSGEEIVIPNKELTNARIQNFRKLEKRRALFSIGVTYETSSEKLRKIPKIVEAIVTSMEKTEFLRANFKEFGDSALVFQVIYYVLSDSFDEYVNIKQEINFKIKEEFEKEEIEMAYPTQTLYIASNQ